MATIASLAVVLKADAVALETGLAASAQKIQQFGRGITSGMESMASSAKNLLTSIPIVGAAFAALPTTGAGFLSFLREGMNEVASMARMADRLGISTESLAGLQLAAGGAAEGMAEHLGHLVKELGQVAIGNAEAAMTFRRFGLDDAALAQLSLDGVIKALADRVSSLESPVERAALAIEFFGRSGMEMLPFLQKGAAGIDAATQRARELGLSFSRLDAQKVLNAGKAMRQIELAIKGAGMQLAIHMAPLVESIANTFVGWIDSLGGIDNAIQTAMTTGIEVFGKFLDVLDAVIARLDGMLGRFENMTRIFDVANALLAPAFMALGMPSSTQAKPGSLGGDWRQMMARIPSIQGARGGGPSLGETSEIARSFEYAKGVIEEMMLPTVRLQKEVNKLNEAFGYGALDLDSYARKLTMLYDQADKLERRRPAALNVLSDQGARAAYSSILENRSGGAENIQERLVRIQQQMLEEERQIKQHARETVEALRQLGLPKKAGL